MKKKYVLVTGGGKRIGSSICKFLALQGWQVIIHYNNSKLEAEKTLQEIEKNNGKAFLIKADLSSTAQIEKLIPRINKKHGQLSMLINNASIFEKDDIKSISYDLWNKHIDVNLKAPLFLSKEFANQLSKRNQGIIINFLDQSVLTYRPNFISYSVSKNSLWYLTRSLAQALSPNIRVRGIGPGPTLQGKRQTKKDFEVQKQVTPLGIGPDLKEINNAINFIINDNSFTGQMLGLDGGEHLKWEETKDKKFVE